MIFTNTMFITKENFLSKDSIDFIENKVLSSSFPYYFNAHTIYDPPDNNAYMGHDILRRPEERNEGEVFNSNYGEPFLKILKEFTSSIDYTLTDIYRISVNITFAGVTEKCPTHIDHPYPHNQLLIYLNDCDPIANTVVLSQDKSKIEHTISPKKYMGACFSSAPHYMIFPRNGPRAIAVFTFV
jgi:hypothetical protein